MITLHGYRMEQLGQIVKNSMKRTLVRELAKMIDHSILQPTHTDQDLEKQCEIARKYDVASVCVKPYAVKMAVSKLKLF
jgi:deoxyribose-phosphate aldolase